MVFPVQLVMTIDFPVKQELLQLLRQKSIDSETEICGFLIKNDDVYDTFLEKKNIHPDPKYYFLISPKDCVFDDDVILFHSHPSHSTRKGFSEWDIKNQEFFCLNMLVYSVNNDDFYYKSI